MSGDPADQSPGIHAEASGHAQQAVLGQGVQNNYWYAGSGPAPKADPTVVDTLVPPPLVMVGRASELRQLRAAAQDAGTSGLPVVVTTVHGMGGAGKTALARALAAEVAEGFTDARIEVDLYGFTPGQLPREPGEVLGELLGLVGFAAADIPARAEGRSALWRSWLSTRRVLLVLDNARDAAQVLPLLPGGGVPGRSLVVVTSRNRLADLEETVMVAVGVLPAQDAVALLVRAGRRDLAGTSSTRAELDTLAGLCGFLPLALRSVGSLLARLDPGELIEVMRSAQHPLQHLTQADQAIAAAFAVSYDALAAALQDALRACAWHPGPDFDAASIAALGSRALPLVIMQLVELLQANMLIGLPLRRYAFHDLFLGYTRRRADTRDDEQAVRAARYRLYGQLQARLDSAAGLVYTDNQNAIPAQPGQAHFTDRVPARDWLSAAAGELTTATHAALADGWGEAAHLAGTLAYWLHADGRSDQASTLYDALHATALAAGNQDGQASALAGLGVVSYARGDYQRAQDAYQQAHDLYGLTGDRRGQAAALKGLGDIARVRGDHQASQDAYRRAYDLYQQIGFPNRLADVLQGLADVAPARDEHEHVQDLGQQG